jgi:transcription elongation factor Elf1
MEDTLTCPVCGQKLSNQSQQYYLAMLNKKADMVQRTCTKGIGHSFQILTDKATNKVDWIKLSLNPWYTRWVEINCVTGRSRIAYLKNGKAEYLDIERRLEPDFPSLERLREKVNIYVVFS